MSTARYLVGDAFTRMAAIPDGSVDLVLTSPPFYALRSYLPADHPDKHREIGSEATPALYLDTLLRLSAEWRRVLAPHGSICVELGDTYAGSGGSGGDYGPGGWRDGQPRFKGPSTRTTPDNFPLDKSLCLLPHLYAASLAYGRNLLTGDLSPAGMWRVRNWISWCRPNPPVGALADKFRPATSYLTVGCVGRSRYFDLDAVRNDDLRDPSHAAPEPRAMAAKEQGVAGGGMAAIRTYHANGGAPPLDWWNIPTHPYPGAHYATWPPALCTRPILAMSPQRVCTTCGQPSERIVGDVDYQRTDTDRVPARLAMLDGERVAPTVHQHRQSDGANTSVTRVAPTVGWSDCGHNTWRRGLILDPFAGSGTTLEVASGHGRDSIGIDLDPRNAWLARDRIGMFVEIDEETVR